MDLLGRMTALILIFWGLSIVLNPCCWLFVFTQDCYVCPSGQVFTEFREAERLSGVTQPLEAGTQGSWCPGCTTQRLQPFPPSPTLVGREAEPRCGLCVCCLPGAEAAAGEGMWGHGYLRCQPHQLCPRGLLPPVWGRAAHWPRGPGQKERWVLRKVSAAQTAGHRVGPGGARGPVCRESFSGSGTLQFTKQSANHSLVPVLKLM